MYTEEKNECSSLAERRLSPRIYTEEKVHIYNIHHIYLGNGTILDYNNEGVRLTTDLLLEEKDIIFIEVSGREYTFYVVWAAQFGTYHYGGMIFKKLEPTSLEI